MGINEICDEIDYELGKFVADIIFKSVDYFIVEPRRELKILTEQNSVMIQNQRDLLRILKERK